MLTTMEPVSVVATMTMAMAPPSFVNPPKVKNSAAYLTKHQSQRYKQKIMLKIMTSTLPPEKF